MSASITLEQIINFLLEAPMFGDLDPTELSEIVHIMQVQRIRDAQPIFREGDPGDAWYVIFDGQADVYKEEDFLPRRKVATLAPRACFGEMAILDHSPRSATVVAAGECTVFRFPRKDFEQLLADGNLAAYKLIYEMAKVLCARARDTSQKLSEALAAAAPDRVRTGVQGVVERSSVSE
jgi:CRP/FNR family cyclic AMP-dependent transcriptional regulator